MKTNILLIAMLLNALITNAQDWKKDRPVSGITGLRVESGIDVFLTQGNSEKLTLDVRGFEEDEIRSSVQNGVLTLTVDRKNGWSMGGRRNTQIKAYLTFKQLRNIQASGGADVTGQQPLTFGNLNLQASGGADMKLNLKADELNLQVSGGADMTVEGSARVLNAESAGGADLDAGKLVAEVCSAYAHGGADMSVNASREITLKAAGGSDISYSGSARLLAKSASGGSDITRRN
jgi:hypothetical protein